MIPEPNNRESLDEGTGFIETPSSPQKEHSKQGYGYGSRMIGAPPTYKEAPSVYQEVKERCPHQYLPTLQKELANHGFQRAEIVNEKMVFPPGFDSLQFFTHIQIIGCERLGHFIVPGLVRLAGSARTHCLINQYENWSFGKEDKPFWQLYIKGN